MPAIVNFTSQPGPYTPIRPEFLNGLIAAFEGGRIASYYRYISSKTMIRCGSIDIPQSATGSPMGYKCSSASVTALMVATTAASPDVAVEIASGSSWTFMCRIIDPTGSGTNPGFWRSQNDELGTTFFIDNGGTQRPWVRMNGTNILQASSGDQWPTQGALNILCRVVSSSSVDVWWGGKKRHSATHSVATPSMTGTSGIWTIGRQNVTEYLNGMYSCVRFWSRALTDEQCSRLTRNPYAFYVPALRSLPGFTPAAGATFNAAWAVAANTVITTGARAA